MTTLAKIENNVLSIGSYTEAMPLLAQDATVQVWTVPIDYKASGYFVAVTPIGGTQEIPACSPVDAVLVAVLVLPASQEAQLTLTQSAKWEAIKRYRDTLSDLGGYKVVVSGVDKWFHSDAKSKTQQIGLVLMGANVPALDWKTMDGSFVVMSQSLANQIFQAAALQDKDIFAQAEAHNEAMLLSGDPAAYDFSGDWPATYIEAV